MLRKRRKIPACPTVVAVVVRLSKAKGKIMGGMGTIWRTDMQDTVCPRLHKKIIRTTNARQLQPTILQYRMSIAALRLVLAGLDEDHQPDVDTPKLTTNRLQSVCVG